MSLGRNSPVGSPQKQLTDIVTSVVVTFNPTPHHPQPHTRVNSCAACAARACRVCRVCAASVCGCVRVYLVPVAVGEEQDLAAVQYALLARHVAELGEAPGEGRHGLGLVLVPKVLGEVHLRLQRNARRPQRIRVHLPQLVCSPARAVGRVCGRARAVVRVRVRCQLKEKEGKERGKGVPGAKRRMVLEPERMRRKLSSGSMWRYS